MLNLINNEPDIEKIYLYAKDPYESKYQLLINKREVLTGIEHLNDTEDFFEYSMEMDDIYKTNEEYNPNKNRKIFIAFDDMIADILSNKNIIQ